MRAVVLLIGASCCIIAPAFAGEPAPAVKCKVLAHIIEANRKGTKEKDKAVLSDDVKEQLKALPYGSYQMVSRGEEEVKLTQQAKFELASRQGNKFLVEVTPHSISENRVNYTLDWKELEKSSLVTTRLEVENDRAITVGANLSDGKAKGKCFVVGVKVTCK